MCVCCIVLMGWSLLPNALRPSWDPLCSPEFGYIRMWICRLNFAQRPIFLAWGSLTSLISQTPDPSFTSLSEDLWSGFLRPEKIHQPQSGLNLRTLDLEARTLPRDRLEVPLACIPPLKWSTILWQSLQCGISCDLLLVDTCSGVRVTKITW